jgi:succinate-acetate transporter protein
MDGANGQTGGKNHSSTFVLTAFISFGLFNIFLVSISVVLLLDCLNNQQLWWFKTFRNKESAILGF